MIREAYFAGGCFWCITPVFNENSAVKSVISGYSGGDTKMPTYEQVKHQETDHRETIKVVYDEEGISFAKLLDIFCDNVDPFDAGGQFIDRGHSYTLAVYYTTDEEKLITEKKIDKIHNESGKEVFIAVEPFSEFWEAEEYHQMYYLKNPEAFEKEMEESGRIKLKN